MKNAQTGQFGCAKYGDEPDRDPEHSVGRRPG